MLDLVQIFKAGVVDAHGKLHAPAGSANGGQFTSKLGTMGAALVKSQHEMHLATWRAKYKKFVDLAKEEMGKGHSATDIIAKATKGSNMALKKQLLKDLVAPVAPKPAPVAAPKPAAKPGGLETVHTDAEMLGSIAKLKAAGVSVEGLSTPAERAKFMSMTKNIAPHEIVKAFVGEKEFSSANLAGKSASLRSHDGGHGLNFSASNIQVHGGRVTDLQRKFDLGAKEIDHSYLRFKEGDQGSGAVKKMFIEQLKIYDHMGIKKVQMHAALEWGAYAWSKYGFHLNKGQSSALAGAMMYRAKNLDAKVANASDGAKKEMTAVRKLLNEGINTDHRTFNREMASIKTPHLDDMLQKSGLFDTMGVKSGTMSKYLFKDNHWFGSLDLTKGSVDRAVTDAYIAKAKKEELTDYEFSS